jgi:hypothetical protein
LDLARGCTQLFVSDRPFENSFELLSPSYQDPVQNRPDPGNQDLVLNRPDPDNQVLRTVMCFGCSLMLCSNVVYLSALLVPSAGRPAVSSSLAGIWVLGFGGLPGWGPDSDIRLGDT